MKKFLILLCTFLVHNHSLKPCTTDADCGSEYGCFKDEGGKPNVCCTKNSDGSPTCSCKTKSNNVEDQPSWCQCGMGKYKGLSFAMADKQGRTTCCKTNILAGAGRDVCLGCKPYELPIVWCGTTPGQRCASGLGFICRYVGDTCCTDDNNKPCCMPRGKCESGDSLDCANYKDRQ